MGPEQVSTVSDERKGPAGLIELDAAVVDDISALLTARQRGMVMNLVADLYPADLALLLSHLPFEEAGQLFRWLPPEQASETLAELNDSFRTALLEEALKEEQGERRLRRLIDALDTDDAADVLADLPDEVALRVLPDLEDTDDLTELLDYGEETAGGIMAREFVAVPADWTLGAVTEEVRRNAEEVDEIYTVFVTDDDGVLQGVVSLKQLLLAPANIAVRDMMEADYISVTPELDQEEVGRIMQRYDLVSLPVVDEEGRLLGRITIDDVVDVIRDEAEEDIQIMSGVTGAEEPTDTVWRISRGRLPWLIVGMVGAGLSGAVIGRFEGALQQAVVLASFIPVVTAMGGNAAVQSAAIAVQGLSSGELWLGDVLRRVGKEMAVALVNGLVLSAVLCGVVMTLQLGNVAALASTLGVTMLAVILLATTNGALVPFALKSLGIDPASAMGPFVTTLNDIIGLTVYFLIATLLYL
jgi:magnesium transporter